MCMWGLLGGLYGGECMASIVQDWLYELWEEFINCVGRGCVVQHRTEGVGCSFGFG